MAKKKETTESQEFSAQTLSLETVALVQINRAPYNPRVNLKAADPERYQALKQDIILHGLVEPLVYNRRTGNLVGGHQRLDVLEELGWTEAPCSVVDISLLQEMALNIALNKNVGEWEPAGLKDLLEYLSSGVLEAMNLNLADATGWLEKETADLMSQFHVPGFEPTSEDAQPRLDQKSPVKCPECGHEFVPA